MQNHMMPDPKPLPHILQNIRAWNPHIHAFVALTEAEQTAHGPLSGLTVGVKDIIDVAGLATRNGSTTGKDARPAPKDAGAVAALRRAGARIIGKTTTTEFAFTDPTDCRNPHDLTRTPGGSSSGSGAAVAAGLVDIALGTQTAGSLCRPAAYCGVVGFKPSYGLLPTTGMTPLAPSFDTIGIIAGSVALAHRAFSVLAPTAESQPQTTDPKVVSGLWDDQVAVAPDTRAALRDATDTLLRLGTDVTQTPLRADTDRIVAAHRTVMLSEAATAHGAMLSDRRGALLRPKFRAGLQAGATISATDAAAAAALLEQARRTFWTEMENVDLIVTLPVPDGPPLIDGTTGFQDWLTPWTVFSGPLVCLPWGLDRLGRPRSVMLAARPGCDATLLASAARLEPLSPAIPHPALPH